MFEDDIRKKAKRKIERERKIDERKMEHERKKEERKIERERKKLEKGKAATLKKNCRRSGLRNK